MKKIFILSIVITSLFITGCGCSKKEKVEDKVLTCYYENNDGEKTVLYFKNNYLIKQENKIMETFPNETLAMSYYNDMLSYGENVKIDGNVVYTEFVFVYDSNDETYLKENVITDINEYDCK